MNEKQHSEAIKLLLELHAWRRIYRQALDEIAALEKRLKSPEFNQPADTDLVAPLLASEDRN